MTKQTPDATICISTRNRKDLLRQALRSAVEQTGNNEILVVDDASEDGTPEMVRAEFPQVRLVVSERARGYIVQRNTAVAMASAPIAITIDDDAKFTTPHVVEQTLAVFARDSRLGALAIRFANIVEDKPVFVFPDAPDKTTLLAVLNFIGTASAVRKEAFLKVGGYNEFLFHWGEEVDLCTRLWASGFGVALADTDPIYHYSRFTGRVWDRNDYIHRNSLLYLWWHAPLLYLIPLFPLSAVYALLRGGLPGTGRSLRTAIKGVTRGVGASLDQMANRKPLPRRIFSALMNLRSKKIVPFRELESLLETRR